MRPWTTSTALRACGRMVWPVSSASFASPRMNPRIHAVLSLVLALSAAASAQSIRLAGSDLAEPALRAALQQVATTRVADWRLDLAGSKPGLDALRAGTADIAVVLLESLPAAQDPAIDYTPLAYRVPVVVVSDRNPIDGISLPALAAVLGEGETENYRRWSDLGLPGGWSARTISAHAASADDPLLLDYLRLRVLKSPRLKTSLATGLDLAAAVARLREDESALGVLPAMPAGVSGIKAVPVAPDASGIPFGPTPENVHAGDYPMKLVLALATVRNAQARVTAACRVLLSDGVAEALAAHGFVPVPSGVRSQQAVAGSAP